MSGHPVSRHAEWVRQARLPDGFVFAREEGKLGVDDFIDIIRRSKLSRPAEDPARLERMLEHANLVVTVRNSADGRLVGVARSLTDFSYCCYLSDLCVDDALHGRGIGRALVAETKRHAGPDARLLLVSSGDAVDFYRKIGMEPQENVFVIDRDQAPSSPTDLIGQRISKHADLLNKFS